MKRVIIITSLFLFAAAVTIIVINPSYIPRRLRNPVRNHRLETMAAMEPWSFRVTTDGQEADYYRHTLRQVEVMYRQLPNNDAGNVTYPDFFGGIIVDGPQLTLLIVEGMLEEAKAHEAFGHFFVDANVYRFVKYSFAQLLETRNQVKMAINTRLGCLYAENVMNIRISAANNQVEISVSRNNNPDRDMEAGFERYVFDSPMVGVHAVFFFEQVCTER